MGALSNIYLILHITRSEATTDLEDDSSLKADSRNNRGESDTGVEISGVDSGPKKEKTSLEAVVSSQLRGEFGVERDMERALEHQAQLIGQYKDMEKEQREWEEKYQENNSSAVVCSNQPKLFCSSPLTYKLLLSSVKCGVVCECNPRTD